MRIALVLKKIDRSLLLHSSKYLFEKQITKEISETLIVPAESDKMETVTPITKNLTLHTIPLNFRVPVIREIIYSLRLLRTLNKQEFDLVALNSHLQIWAIPVIISTMLSKVPLVVTIHGVYSKTNLLLDTIQKMYLHTFCRIIWSKARAIVCLTEADSREISSYGCPREKIVVIPNWVNTDLFRPIQEKQKNKILWAGRFVPPKGLEYLVKAARVVVTADPSCKFVLIGEGPLKPQIQEMVSNENLNEWFEFRGYLTNDQVASEMANASIFAFPSLKEGMPYAILEAAASGMAIVASDIPGIRAVLKDGEHGLLVKPENHVLLADAIIRLLRSDKLRSDLQKNARKFMEDSFAAEIIVRQTLDLYQEIIQKHSSIKAND